MPYRRLFAGALTVLTLLLAPIPARAAAAPDPGLQLRFRSMTLAPGGSQHVVLQAPRSRRDDRVVGQPGHQLAVDPRRVDRVRLGVEQGAVARGADPLAKHVVGLGKDDVEEVVVGLQGAGRRAARHGYAVLDESGERVGEVTSGAPSPTLGHPIALARVRRDVAAEGTSLQVDLRGRGEPFTVVATPFYRRER